MRVWTLQAPEVASALRRTGRYRPDWDRVPVNWRIAYGDMLIEMRRRGIDCGDGPPVWCWPGRARPRKQVRMTANLLLGDDQWARGVDLLELDIPNELTVTTSYGRWNDHLERTMSLTAAEKPCRMDWRPTPVHDYDALQVVVPELRREWLVRVRPYPPDAETAARIATDPDLAVFRAGSGH
ncbi:hypothetical protein NDR87_22810 [Nocardia sp. CDC159]|uniref:DUF3841 domain-containing protein n=1 Tax=Nocardia pulmonis TaxID=2951408 RepID=A0A9X2IYR1_9NOCA|nr:MULTISPECIES: hypothetical protein [Nocardia]MCM6776648.1 hypothetical protein [Nocardia pulmonis]MCM6789203.1 hypothetical protein [Nocardia sp. CDC159]